uniref:Uncharacterized protein n=1 Tax=Romanomermis culicivorax TaxID=13658 RepID=A0A915KL03_ROMCU
MINIYISFDDTTSAFNFNKFSSEATNFEYFMKHCCYILIINSQFIQSI